MIELLQCSKRRVILSPEGGESHEEQTKSDRSCSQKGCGTRTAQRCKPDDMCRYFPAESARSIEALQEQQVMATTLAERIVRKLIAVSVVEEGDRELYIYGFFLLITRFYFFLATIAFGCFLKIPCESVIFYIVFILLRSYAGGIHAKTETACTIWTTLAMATATAFIKILECTSAKIPVCFLLCNICILTFSPLDSGEKPLDIEDRRRYQKICVLLLLIFDVVALVANYLAFPVLYYPVICGICLEAVLLSIGKLSSALQEK